MDYSIIFVCLMGMGTVFFRSGLPDRADDTAGPYLRPQSKSRSARSGSPCSRASGEPAGADRRHLRRHRGRTWHRYYRHPNSVRQEAVSQQSK